MDIDTTLVTRLVAAQFPDWADLPITPVDVDGWDNRTFRLGADMLVRLPSGEWYAAQVLKEQRWLPVLAPSLPLPIPRPLAMAEPAAGYPWNWSVYRWLDGQTADVGPIAELSDFATQLAGFLAALQQADPAGGPAPGQHSAFRGGPLEFYAAETRQAIAALGDEIATAAVLEVWNAALAATWHGPPVWFHGDVAASNLLVRDGRLSAVIDFGCSGVGDPACDLTIAWTVFRGDSLQAFRRALPVDAATWARGRGWALWKALITLVEHRAADPVRATQARLVIGRVLADREQSP